MKTKLYVVGDIHADWSALNIFINKKKPDVIFQVGDFGFWPHILDNGKAVYYRKAVKNKNTQIFWCPGNHENWDILEEKYGRRGRNPIEIDNTNREPHTGIFYCPIGSVVKINGLNWMFIGGADSVDKRSRVQSYTWWSQELLNYGDIEFCLQTKERIDGIISHTVPTFFNTNKSKRFDKFFDPSRKLLDTIFTVLNPKLWYAGHWHFHMQGQAGKCNWEVLDFPRHGMKWYEEIIADESLFTNIR